jgi:SAM-dependent methyltransferase
MFTARYEQGEYLEKVPDWHAADAPWKAGHVLQMMRRHRLEPRTVADVGCGAGGILVELQAQLDAGTSFTGYDISSQAIALCRSRENARLRFHHGDFLRETPETFDLLLCLDVFEHVGNYLEFLRSLRARARRMIFHVPLDLSVQSVARSSRYMLYMRRRYGHLHYFTAETAFAALTDAGYAIDDAFYTWDNEPLGWPERKPGLRGRLLHPLRCAAYDVEHWLYRHRPSVAARLRPGFNLLVLAHGNGDAT